MGSAAEGDNRVRRVVSNTGPVLHLSEAGTLDLLRWTGEVYIPRAVETEMVHYDPDWERQRPTWMGVIELTSPYDAEAAGWQQGGLLDAGEAEAVALARQLNAQWGLPMTPPRGCLRRR